MIKIGNVVEATAGKEKGKIFVVVGLNDKYAYLSDGKRLKTNKPKKKSFKHIKLFNELALSEAVVLDLNERANCAIRKFLSKLRSENV